VEALSIGHALDVKSARRGAVHSVYAHAVNLLMGDDLWTLLATQKADMPFGIRAAVPDFETFALRRGEVVNAGAAYVTIGSHLTIDCRVAQRWSPVNEGQIAPGLTERLAAVTEAAHHRSWNGSAEIARAMKSAMHTPAKIGGTLARVVGLGPGATPSGDDVLVGIFAVLNSPRSGAAGAHDGAQLRQAILPLLGTTTDLSAHLLRQAADGLFGRDLHELRSALLAEDFPGQLHHALRHVVDTGATSGADMCEGLLAFAPDYFMHLHERLDP
jgi:hypothetical protein